MMFMQALFYRKSTAQSSRHLLTQYSLDEESAPPPSFFGCCKARKAVSTAVLRSLFRSNELLLSDDILPKGRHKHNTADCQSSNILTCNRFLLHRPAFEMTAVIS